jgi:hypothetical protein
MPAEKFTDGDPCRLDLLVSNPGTATEVDLYLLLDVFGRFFAYPSWQEITSGLDWERMELPAGMEDTLSIIPEFTMPPVPPAGPLFFYAAMFEAGLLDLEHLASNGSVWAFSLE